MTPEERQTLHEAIKEALKNSHSTGFSGGACQALTESLLR
jgi:hypothetical protein